MFNKMQQANRNMSQNRNDSGLYTMFYARYFDGEILTRILTRVRCLVPATNILLCTIKKLEMELRSNILVLQESIRGQRANLMCQLLEMKDNVGTQPYCIQDALDASLALVL